MKERSASRSFGGWHAARLWAGWLAGPLAWAAHETGGFVLSYQCDAGKSGIYVLSAVTVLIALAGGILARSNLLRARRYKDQLAKGVYDRVRFMGWIGLGLSTLSAVGIALETLPRLMGEACAS